MNYDKVREYIIEILSTSSGYKSVELIMKVMEFVGPTIFDKELYNSILINLIKEGEIIELGYAVPQMSYRVKSIYFPKGTVIHHTYKTEK